MPIAVNSGGNNLFGEKNYYFEVLILTKHFSVAPCMWELSTGDSWGFRYDLLALGATLNENRKCEVEKF